MGIKYDLNENFFDSWSPTMAYVLGFIYADGSLEDASYLRGKYVRVTSTDEHIVRNIKTWLEAEHPIVVTIPPPPWKTRYLLRIGSHYLFNSLTKRGLFPNKSLTMTLPEIPDEFFAHFVRGYFDGDGCAYLERRRGISQALIIKKLTVVFTSGSQIFLEQMEERIRKYLQLRTMPVYKNNRAFQLRYSTKDSIRLFIFFYSNTVPDLYFARKFAIFQQYFTLRPTRIDQEVAKILSRA